MVLTDVLPYHFCIAGKTCQKKIKKKPCEVDDKKCRLIYNQHLDRQPTLMFKL